jgi:hypothetical protein
VQERRILSNALPPRHGPLHDRRASLAGERLRPWCVELHRQVERASSTTSGYYLSNHFNANAISTTDYHGWPLVDWRVRLVYAGLFRSYGQLLI